MKSKCTHAHTHLLLRKHPRRIKDSLQKGVKEYPSKYNCNNLTELTIHSVFFFLWKKKWMLWIVSSSKKKKKEKKTFTIPTLDAVKRTNPQNPFLKIYQQNHKSKWVTNHMNPLLIMKSEEASYDYGFFISEREKVNQPVILFLTSPLIWYC